MHQHGFAKAEFARTLALKRGLSRHYWNDFMFLAYLNRCADRIYWTGLPDRPESLPHSQQGRDHEEA